MHSYGIVAGTFRFGKWLALPCVLSAYHRLWKPAFLPSVPNWAFFSTVCFSHCNSHVASAKMSTSVTASFKFTVDVMQDEKVIAVMPISRSF